MSAVLAAAGPRPDCVFAVNDVMAMGALARLRAGGLQVPADIALAGFDDIGTLRDVYPPLTTVRLPLKRMGEMAASLVLAEAAAQPRPTATQPTTSSSRGSSRCPARSSSGKAPSRARPADLSPGSCAPGCHQVRFAEIGKRLPDGGPSGQHCVDCQPWPRA